MGGKDFVNNRGNICLPRGLFTIGVTFTIGVVFTTVPT